ncbi:hypothetical protein [Novispirillum itersonii]|uniref:hypothetical protein n=1 Tax=Novispirillum itersonii TaxID=189 RepID=UPI001FE08E7D|nr:hypothetical protein [Novispirillum itersonii]
MAGGSPSVPTAAPTPEPAKEPVKQADTQVQQASDSLRRQAALAGASRGGTLLTGGQGLTAAADLARKTLLGA